MANLLQADSRFGLKGNKTYNTALNTLGELMDPAQNKVSPLPRLQQERDIYEAEAAKKDAATGDFAAAGLQNAGVLNAIQEAMATTADKQSAEAGYQEAQTQEMRDRMTQDAYLALVMNPQISAQQLNEEERALREQMEQIKKSRSQGKIMGIVQFVGGAVLTAATLGAAAPIGVPMMISGAAMYSANS